MNVVVVTVAHMGDDARIVHRQARSLLEEGHHVTLIGPSPAGPRIDPPGLRRFVTPRAKGLRRLKSWRTAKSEVARLVRNNEVDLLLLHDIELVAILLGEARRVTTVWDVHEDFAASVSDRKYIWSPFHGIIRSLVLWIERRALKYCHIILAESSYSDRLGDHPVIANSTWVPDHEPLQQFTDPLPRVVYVGRISKSRGAIELIEIGGRLRGRVRLQLIGEPDSDVKSQIVAAHERGDIEFLGFLSNPKALEVIQGALVGVSLLHEHPNFIGSLPTKILEYFAYSVPVITSELPLAASLVQRADGGFVVGFNELVEGAIESINLLLNNPKRQQLYSTSGHHFVREHYSWQHEGEKFVLLLEKWAHEGTVRRELSLLRK